MNRFSTILIASTLAYAGRAPAQTPSDTVTRSIALQSHYLHFPVKRGAPQRKLNLYVDGVQVREIDISLATETPDFWVHTDVSEWKGKTLVVRMPPPSPDGGVPAPVTSPTLASITQSDQRDGEAEHYREALRPQFHYSPLRGWLGDSNGLVYYAGEWHLFYQHNPFDVVWGNMTWGHAVSPDLVHWTELDNALHPDQFGAVWTGSAVADTANTSGLKQGKEAPIVAIYTSWGGSPWSQGHGAAQSLSYSLDRGRHWIKYPGNPVLEHPDVNRDPKVFWHEPTHQWVMIVFGNGYPLFTSPDLIHWTKLQDLHVGDSNEMPDMFELAVDGNPKNTKWVITGPSDWYVVGSFDGKKFTLEQDTVQGDLGDNYGAVSTFNNVPASDGRRIQQGWLRGASVAVPFDLPGMPFNQQMAFPRELTLHSTPQGLRVFGVPAREIAVLHQKAHHWSDVRLSSDMKSPIDPVSAELSHLKATFIVDTTKPLPQSFGFDMRGYHVVYNTAKRTLAISDSSRTVKEVPVPAFNGPMTWEILQDRTSVEIFINGGIVRLAFGYIPSASNRTVQPLVSGGAVVLKVLDVFELKSAWR